ncbi:MAG: hypothetical protein ABI743_13140, partial [bacterium]
MNGPATPSLLAGVLHADRPYGLLLVPYLVLSFVAHVAIGGALGYKHLVKVLNPNASGGIETFKTPEHDPNATPPDRDIKTAKAHPLRFTLNYFPSVILPVMDLPPDVPIPEPIPEPEPVKPKVPVKPKPPTAEVPLPVPVPAGPVVPSTDLHLGFLNNKDGAPLHLPAFELHTLRDDQIRTAECFSGYPTLILIADVSTETGMEDLFTWMRFYHDLFHQPGVVSPPWVLGIGVALEDPYFLPTDAAEEMMKLKLEEKNLFYGPLWGDVAFDGTNQFLNGLEMESLPAPQV